MEKKDKKIKKKATNSVLVKENKDLKTELNKYKDEKLRLMADFENLKKRKNDEISNLIKYSGESLITIAFNKPLPLILVTKLVVCINCINSSRNKQPSAYEF